MKRLILIFLTALTLASCEENIKSTDIPENTNILELEYSETHIDYTINEFPIRVKANCAWTASCEKDWVSITPEQESYTNSILLHIRVQNNTTTESRSAEIIFSDGKKEVLFTIIQDAFEVYLNASESDISFGHRAAEKHIKITSNCGWYAKASQTWIAIKPSTGLIGDFDMLINVESNGKNESRSGQILIWNEDYGAEISIEISQDAKPEENTRSYVDENGIDRGFGTAISGLTWAPVNCGYKENDFPYGKMYQWGRSNGLGYQDDSYKDSLQNSLSDIWKGKNGEETAGTFYRPDQNSKFGYDWISQGSNDFWNLGTEQNPIKNGTYDPCPVGWRVPTAYEFSQLISHCNKEWKTVNEQTGYVFSSAESAENTIFLPAGGRLNASDGQAFDRNIEGYYWCNSASEAGSSSYMYFHSLGCNINHQGSRAGGCLVRCIQE